MKFLHTRFRVSDMDRSVDFYTKVLGLAVSRKTVSPRGFPLVFLHAPTIMTGDKTQIPELELVQLPGKFSVPEDLMHIAFEVEDISKFKSILSEEPMKTSFGSIIAFVSDPDGYEIELIQRN